MTFLTTPLRLFRTALMHVQRHGWHTITAISVMTLTFIISSLFVLAALGSNVILHYFEKQPQLIIFLKDDASHDRVMEIQHALEQTGKTDKIHYTSKDEAFAFYKNSNKNDPQLVENLSANILPASLDVSPKDAEDLNVLAGIAKDHKYDPFIESVSYQPEVVDKLKSFTQSGRIVGLVLIGFLTIVSFLIVLVTIGLNIASYNDEIEVMRLVGAGSWYIRAPFLLEGVFYGVVSAILSTTVVYFGLPLVADRVQRYLTGIQIFPIPVIPVIGGLLGMELLFGIILGIVGSWVAMRRSLQA
jgi:cell division transport system permease protein